MEQATAQQTGTIVERFTLKAFVEACLVLEEGVASLKDIEIGMMTGAGILPGPFARADERGLDEMLAALERAESGVGRGLRAAARSCAASSRRGGSAARPARASSPTRSPTPGFREGDGAARDARRGGGDLAQPPAREPDEPGR